MSDPNRLVLEFGGSAGRDEPDALGLVQQQARPALQLVHDVMGGTFAVRQKKQQYLPQFPLESDARYKARLNSSVLFNALKSTVRGLTGMVHRKPAVLQDDVATLIRTQAENIDLQGRKLPVFLRDVTEAVLRDGHSDILVDMQVVPEGQPLTETEAVDAGRPYWVLIHKGAVLRVRVQYIGGRAVLTSYAYLERSTEPDGEFTERAVQRVRQFDRVVQSMAEGGVKVPLAVVNWQTWKRTEGPHLAKWEKESNGTLIDAAGNPLGEIPVATAYGDRIGFMASRPPLEDLAHENIAHYQIRSDRTNSLHVAGVPIPVFVGIEDSEIAVGSNKGITLPLGGSASYLEAQGSSLSEMREELTEIRSNMATLGLSMLQRDSRAAETAEAKRIEAGETHSRLSDTVTSIEDAAQAALGLHALWLGLPQKEGGTVLLNRDFEELPMDAGMVQTLSGLVSASQLSIETMWEALVRGEVLPDGFDAEVEKQKLADSADLALIGKLKQMLDQQKQPGPDDEDDEEEDE